VSRQANGRTPRQSSGPGHNGSDRPDRTENSSLGGDARAPGGRLALSTLDWIAAACLAIVLLISPIWAAGFATPAQPVVFAPSAVAEEGVLALAMEIWAGPLSLLLIAMACVLLAWREWKRPVAVGAVPGLAAALGMLGAWAIFSAAPNHSIYLSLNALSCLFGALLLGGIVSRLGRDRHCIDALSLTIALAGGIIAGIGVREYLGELKDGVVNHRTFSTFGPDFLAGYLLLTLPVTMAAFSASSTRSLRLMLGVTLALQSACLFLTGSRAGTAIAVVAVLVWIALALLTGSDRTRRRWIACAAAIFVVSSALSATPTFARFGGAAKPASTAAPAGSHSAAEDTQAHSGEFRKQTWIGTVRMAMRNPLIGTGIGTFSTAYPRYSDTAYTAHAHNSFLQWTAETGLPGMLSLLTAFAAASAFTVHIVLLMHARRNEPAPAVKADDTPARLEAPGLMLGGFIAALIASILHSFFDSDLYIVATLFTFSALFGLSIAQARALAPLAVQTPRRMGRELWAVGLFLALSITVRASQVGFSRSERARTAQSQSEQEAIAAARVAASADPFDPEPHLLLAQLQRGTPAALAELQSAAHIAPGGMTYYLVGRYYREAGQYKPAIDAFERARTYEPHNLQALRALAETQRKAGLPVQARFTYETMTALENSVYGSVRAMPELIETDFAYAHAGLGDIAAEEGNLELADGEYLKARGILSRYWNTRTWLINQNRQPEKRRALADLYVHVLQANESVLTKEGRRDESRTLDGERQKVEADILADEEKLRKSGG